MVWEETWSLVGKWGSFTSIITGAPSASLAGSGTSALPLIFALLSSVVVVGFSEFAVVRIISSSSDTFVGREVVFPEHFSVIKFEHVNVGGLNVNSLNVCDSKENSDGRFHFLN